MFVVSWVLFFVSRKIVSYLLAMNAVEGGGGAK